MSPDPSRHRERLVNAVSSALAEDERVVAALVFGSRASGGECPASDVDVAVLVDEAPQGRQRYELVRSILLSLSSRIAGERLDLVILNDAPPLLAFRVLRDGVLALCRDEVLLHRFKVRTYDLHADRAPVEALFRRATRERAPESAGRG